jgi:hypothetical protein
VKHFAELEETADLQDHHLGVKYLTAVIRIAPKAHDTSFRKRRATV